MDGRNCREYGGKVSFDGWTIEYERHVGGTDDGQRRDRSRSRAKIRQIGLEANV